MAISHTDGELFARLPKDPRISFRRTLLGLAYLLVPRRIPNLFPLAVVALRDLTRPERAPVPNPERAFRRPDGLCGFAGELDTTDLMEGYRRGMFVMSHIGPMKWWAPQNRMVLFFDQARIEKNTRRLLRNGRFRFTMDAAFADVMRACAAPRSGHSGLTWITRDIARLFQSAHEQGHAHSLEVWQDDKLVGGIYGLAVGQVFFTESQFHSARDASKSGFAVLNRHLQKWGFALNDGKHPTRYLGDCGMRAVTRQQLSRLTETYGSRAGNVGKWQIDPALLDGGWVPSSGMGLKMRDVLPEGSQCRWSLDELLSQQRSNTW